MLKEQYVYNFTDHLGNVRLSYSDTSKDGVIQPRMYNASNCSGMFCLDDWRLGEIAEVNNYYPFGLLHNYTATSQNAYQYKYNGKELQESGMYDYGWRQYMPDVGRWFSIDPLAEKDTKWSPYRYAYDNPIRYIDPEGLWEIELRSREIIKRGKATGKQEQYIAFVAQKGDDINTLAEQTGIALDQLTKGLEGVEIKEGSSLEN